MKIWFGLPGIIFVALLSTGALAVPFTASSDPSGANGGQSSQLLNFTIQNTGSVNITRLNITLPASFVFSSSGTTTTSPYTASSSFPAWTNSSSIGLVGNGATQYFWVYLTTISATGNYGFNVSTLDANGVFNSTNVTINVFDTLAPTYSSNTTSPSTNSTYVQNQTYWFNITWSDNIDISKVLIEHNITGSGTPHNDTMSNSSSVYYSKFTDLAAGTYVWRVYANDTNNTFNSTQQLTYTINKAANIITVFLNGTSNGNITSINNTAINITTTASCTQTGCTVSITRDGTSIASGGTLPYSKTDDVITSVGRHNYSITVTSNANFSTNSSTYFVATIPSYSVTTSSIPSTFSNSTSSLIITFDGNPDVVNLYTHGDWTGSNATYTMSNNSATTYFYNTTFPAGNWNWNIHGIFSNHTFNITKSSFTVNPASPTILLNITPQWTLDSPIQTNVTCTSSISSLTAKIYRNNTLATNPDVQTFNAGTVYEYLCNNTVNQNYTVATQKNMLIIKPTPTGTIAFIDTTALMEVKQNSTASFTVKVKNTGTIGQNVTLAIAGIDRGWYSLTESKNILVGQTAEFTLTFDIKDQDPKEYSGEFNASSQNSSISQNFTLKILPSEETQSEIKDRLALFKLEVSKLESSINESRTAGVNVLQAEEKLAELKSKFREAEDALNSGDYVGAFAKFETIESLITQTREQLKKLPAVAQPSLKIPSTWIYVGIGIVVIVIVGFVIYLFLPSNEGYKPGTGEYVWAGKETIQTPKKGIAQRIKELLSKLKFWKGSGTG